MTDRVWTSEAAAQVMTGQDLARACLRSTNGFEKPVLVDTGDGIFMVRAAIEYPDEIIITLGDMP